MSNLKNNGFEQYFAEFVKTAADILLYDISFVRTRGKIVTKVCDKKETKFDAFTIMFNNDKYIAFNNIDYGEISQKINDKLSLIDDKDFFKSTSFNLVYPTEFNNSFRFLFKLESEFNEKEKYYNNPVLRIYVVDRNEFNQAKSQYSNDTLCKVEKLNDSSCIII